jgi:hypothetical protein
VFVAHVGSVGSEKIALPGWLDMGIVIDAWVGVSLVGAGLLAAVGCSGFLGFRGVRGGASVAGGQHRAYGGMDVWRC